MRVLNRHVALHVLVAVLLVSAVLLGLFAVAMFADELSEAPDNYSFAGLMAYVALRLPGLAVANTGFAVLIGCMLGLGVLASQSEVTVMRASGVSVQRIAWMVLRPMLVLIVLVSLLGEYAVPDIERRASRLKSENAEQEMFFGLIDSSQGLWMRQDDDFLHFNNVTPKGEISGFARLVFSPAGELLYAQYAPRAEYVTDGSMPGWVLRDVRVTRFGIDVVSTEVLPEDMHWYSELEPALLSTVVSEPATMSMRELRYYMNYLVEQGQDNRNFELVFWQKALQPLAMTGLVLVAISFIFGPLRDTTMGYRLFMGVMVGIVFRFSQDLLGPTSLVYGFPPLLAIVAPIAVCWIVGLVLLRRTR